MLTGDKRSAPEESRRATRSTKSKKKEYEWLERRVKTTEKKQKSTILFSFLNVSI
jgi:hypothetical protein